MPDCVMLEVPARHLQLLEMLQEAHASHLAVSISLHTCSQTVLTKSKRHLLAYLFIIQSAGLLTFAIFCPDILT